MMKVLFEKKFNTVIGDVTYRVFDSKPKFNMVEVNQVHGVMLAKSNQYNQDNQSFQEADGLIRLFKNSELHSISNEKGKTYPLSIKTADCLPVVMIGNKGIALIHAGWRGLHKGILTSQELNKIEVQEAFIGPSIQKDSYQVGEEFKKIFSQFEECFLVKKGLLFLDLPCIARKQIQNHFENVTVESSNINTFNTKGYHSFRRDQTLQRNYNILF